MCIGKDDRLDRAAQNTPLSRCLLANILALTLASLACSTELGVARMLWEEIEGGGGVGKEVSGVGEWKNYVGALGEIVRVSRLVEGGMNLMNFVEKGGEGGGGEREAIEENWGLVAGEEEGGGCGVREIMDKVEEILVGIGGEDEECCELTLLPLRIGGGEVMNKVEYERKEFFACVINLWVNKVGLAVQ